MSPTARRGPAGGVGDGLGVEGSQAAASGTQGWGAGGWVQPGLGAPHLGARFGRALPAFPGGADPPGQPLRGGAPAFAAARAPLPRDLRPRRCHHPDPGLHSRLFSTPVLKRFGSCLAFVLRSAQMVVTGLLAPGASSASARPLITPWLRTPALASLSSASGSPPRSPHLSPSTHSSAPIQAGSLTFLWPELHLTLASLHVGLGASPPSSPSLSVGEMKSRVGIGRFWGLLNDYSGQSKGRK